MGFSIITLNEREQNTQTFVLLSPVQERAGACLLSITSDFPYLRFHMLSTEMLIGNSCVFWKSHFTHRLHLFTLIPINCLACLSHKITIHEFYFKSSSKHSRQYAKCCQFILVQKREKPIVNCFSFFFLTFSPRNFCFINWLFCVSKKRIKLCLDNLLMQNKPF